ncbi:MAG TPA: daunorubicin ABC transporter ATP-binding protein, partial [Marmoricola sp.]|nr:daunorubicin ABC transporter ATP-binding protein [Marmoricola sp.]
AQPLLAGVVKDLHLDEDSRQFSAPADLSSINKLATLLAEHQIEVDDLGLKRPSLDDVFLHLTGHRAESTDESSEPTQGVTK